MMPPAPASEPWPADLQNASAQEWLAAGRQLIWKNRWHAAADLLTEATRRHPASYEIALALAGACTRVGRANTAEETLGELLLRQPGDAVASLLLARLRFDQGRALGAAEVFREQLRHGGLDTESLIQATEWLDDAQRPQEAAALCEASIASGHADPRVHAYAGMLAAQLGEFERARVRYLFALEHAGDAVEWSAPLALSALQRYDDPKHPDLALFQALLQRPSLSNRARAELLFALGKTHDDLGDPIQATRFFREANQLAHANANWSRKQWRRLVQARIAATAPPALTATTPAWAPLFIVGAPRSGTTLLAERLSRFPQVCLRGELPWLARAAAQLEAKTHPSLDDFARAAATYAMHLRQDLPPARWYIDKQPLNLLHVDVAMTLWPQARFIHCRRSPRDTALSIWQQSFHDPDYGFAYDFDDIAALIHGTERLMTHWLQRYPEAIFQVHYEEMVGSPESTLARLAEWLDLPPKSAQGEPGAAPALKTASM